MTDYRLVMSLLIQNMSYRQIETLAACSHTTIARAKKICRDHNLTTSAQINELGAEHIDALFTDGRKTPSAEFVAFDVAAMVKNVPAATSPHCVSCGPTTLTPTPLPVNATTATNGSARSSPATSTSTT